MQSLGRALEHPNCYLLALFLAWKTLLLLVAVCSPGPGYDTSTNLLFSDGSEGAELPLILEYIVQKLTRWDAIYFVKVAHRGYVFEQEWAFGWGFSRLIAVSTAVLRKALPYVRLEGLVAIGLAHLAHLLSVLVLFQLTLAIFPTRSSRFAFVASVLHIISPAGLFLSAPFAESSCALLSFCGCVLYSKSFSRHGVTSISNDILIILSGVLFGVATTFRSNGILNGVLLLEEAVRTLLQFKHGINLPTLRRLIATGLSGLIVAFGFILPQYIAYSEYCADTERIPRSWCTKTIPSIYTFVQEHYWNVGLFRYWTLSNIPLFALAAPMYTLLIKSSLWALSPTNEQYSEKSSPEMRKGIPSAESHELQILRSMALSQLALVTLTLSTAHVQIISRISSAFPVWIWYTAALVCGGKTHLAGPIVKFMVGYAIVQGGLFASFLPPA